MANIPLFFRGQALKSLFIDLLYYAFLNLIISMFDLSFPKQQNIHR
jgi:hypothetical protein